MARAEKQHLISNKKQKKRKEKTAVGFFEIFRFSDNTDKLLMILGSLAAFIDGLILPIVATYYGPMASSLVNSQRLGFLVSRIHEYLHIFNLTRGDILRRPALMLDLCPTVDVFYNTSGRPLCDGIFFNENVSEGVYAGVVAEIAAGCVTLLTHIGGFLSWIVLSERQCIRNIAKIQTAIGHKTAVTIQCLTTGACGFVVAYWYNWKLTAVVSCLTPFLVCSSLAFTYITKVSTLKEQQGYAKAGAVVEEALSSVRTVVAFGGEEREVKRYEKRLGTVDKHNHQKGLIVGASLGFISCSIFFIYDLTLWYGSKLLRNNEGTTGHLITTYFGLIIGLISLGFGAPHFQSLNEARVAAYEIFKLIDLKPRNIDSTAQEGEMPARIIGNIRFQNVQFAYPSRPGVKILTGVDMDIQPGQTVAIVGASGCGKSTMVQLLLRFYDPQIGRIFIDDIDLKDFNVGCLRRGIGLVSQEPVLFDATIAENIRYGREDVTMTEIIEAAKNANAIDFISRLPEKFKTFVGDGGAKLSGGQKQRIAIARALVRDPKILLLDEATSALDTESESIVQDALDKARKGRTTLIIAHRLSSIQSADVIIGFGDGGIQEMGTHDALMDRGGIYYKLVTSQMKGDQKLPGKTINDNGKLNNGVNFCKELIEEDNKFTPYSNLNQSETKQEETNRVSIVSLLSLNSGEWKRLAVGFLGAMLNGLAHPIVAFSTSGIFKSFSLDGEEQEKEVNFYCCIILGCALVAIVANLLQYWMFIVSGNALTKQLRVKTFRAIMKQEMAWFDHPSNSPGCLTNILANEAAQVQEATDMQVGMVLMCVAAAAGTYVITFTQSSTLSLAALIVLPMIALCGILQSRIYRSKAETVGALALRQAGKISVESVQNIRTVAALSMEKKLVDIYARKANQALNNVYTKGLFIGSILAAAESLIYWTIACIFYFGANMIEKGEIDSGAVFRVYACLVFVGKYLGNALTYGPDVGRAHSSVKIIFSLLQRKTLSDIDLPGQEISKEALLQCPINFQDVAFRYPTRPEVQVLQRMNFTVEPGQTVALVGSSGCGKSTCIALMERFYNNELGHVKIGEDSIDSLSTRWLRSQIGLVSQEPALFDVSIAENIAYGDITNTVGHYEIIQAARQANIHNFIEALPQGYATVVGFKGTQLSGGQKQRVAIARALIRQPKILLLDEATSALDTESETIVQEALDNARIGRTCIIIAHRLSAIQDADKIIVIDQGHVVEQGTHKELMALKGFYFRLRLAQNF